MPTWLKGMLGPTVTLWLYALGVGVAACVSPYQQMPKAAEWMSQFCLCFVIAPWVTEDARKRGRNLCYDFGSFVFFVPWLLAPVYLFQTRGWRALITLLCFAAIWVFSLLPVLFMSVVREFSN